LIIASNRLPVTVVRGERGVELRESVGGLATGLKSFLAKTNGGRALGIDEVVWLGWSGVPAESEGDDVAKALRERGMEPVPLTSKEVEGFYEGFCNSTLWPLFHGFTTYAVYREEWWEQYVKANEKFAERIASVARPGDLVWIHDYHLMLAPAMVKARAPDAAVGFFLHIPFPPPDVLQLMPSPWRSAILEGLLGADLVGFHIREYVANFAHSVVRFLGYLVEAGVAVLPDKRRVRAEAFPMGIDFDFFYSSSGRADVKAEADRLREMLGGVKVVLSIDRLDYTKGVINRIYAWELFLKRRPEWRGRATLVAVVVPSRAGVAKYEEMKREIDREVGRINGELGELNWVPVLYLYRFLPTPTLLALYNVADVALVTPLRDGMNLIAKEYVASKRGEPGVLVLSETAGAAKELAGALTVNPNDVGEMAEAIAKALEMPEEEKRRRVEEMQRRLREYDVVRWGRDFVESLKAAYAERKGLAEKLAVRPLAEVEDELLKRFREAKKRLLLLDYDGTLVPLQPYAQWAAPDSDLLSLLGRLAASPSCDVVIISGRPRGFLDKWFGGLGAGLVAEHGAWIKRAGSEWAPAVNMGEEWRQHVRRIMEDYASRLPGSYIEEKEMAVAFHYRNADRALAEKAVKELMEALATATQGLGLRILRGNMVLEVKPAGVDKGSAARAWLRGGGYDFVLAAGDDETDEDMFAAMPEDAYTIKVGPGPSLAKYYVDSPDDIRRLLSALASEAAARAARPAPAKPGLLSRLRSALGRLRR
jgi:trehalose 6-phosphate synthase/phosphatase